MEGLLITGGTGFLGTELLRQLVKNTDGTIYVLVRAESVEEAEHRLKLSFDPFPELVEAAGRQIIALPGDFAKPGLGLSEEADKMLRERVSHVCHLGAQVNLQIDESEMMETNVGGTENMITFARSLDSLEHFIFVSTAYVSSTVKGLVKEDQPLAETYATLYEKSKILAERALKDSGLPFSVVRPSMIVGHSETGYVKNFNTIYYVLKLLLTKNLFILPVRKDMRLDLVPVDYVAGCISELLSKPAQGRVYHLTCPRACQPRVCDLVEHVRRWAGDNLLLDLPGMIYLPLPFLKKAGLNYNRKTTGKSRSTKNNLLALMPYFFNEPDFDTANTAEDLHEFQLDWQQYIDPILNYACRRNFMHQSERSVFQQAAFRRKSRKYPVTYYDVSQDGIVKTSGSEVNERIDALAAALYSWGIRAGDKIALTGINSIDYMVLDQALGILGTTSVPIYYTAPAEEVELLLKKSGASWFFIGDARMMKQITEVKADCRMVSFSNGTSVSSQRVMTMDDFMAVERQPLIQQRVSPDDLATIRYTSGTTGEPKGVMFNYRQLAWMGQVLTELLGWKQRNEKMCYLSFLPQSHVVEGILAAYAPYYMLAEVDYYYLNDFNSLTQALPKVRPNVFFSVPRFYEKVWEQLENHPMGQKYLNMGDGFCKNLLGRILKKVILKKAGLDRCSQLIVGSAPVSQQLLMDYRALGIEIYNAYGQTEAPLITINRAGDNVIPSIGTPLPETEVWVTHDGELMVRGPQVALGYYGLKTDTIKDGLLKTGDIGSMDEKGHIYLQGRKKEMIITSYGKNINIPKIEEKLKDIKGVSQAVLIGENRPYCTALLWLEKDSSQLQQDIENMNENLSHPEQIRRYTVIDKPLSIKDGELTPNLKVKRKKVEEHYQKEIEDMYR